MMHQGFGVLARTRVGWVLVGVGAEWVSMAAFGQLERVLLRAAGARLTLRSVLATAYNANAIAVAVPVVGSAVAAAYAFRDFRRGGADAGQASIALAVAGVFSAVAFAVIAAFGVALAGNAAAAVLALAGGPAGAALIAVLLVSMRYARARARLVAVADRAVRGCAGSPAGRAGTWPGCSAPRRRPWTARRAPELSAGPLPPLRADGA